MKNRINWSNLPPTADGMTFADAKKAYSMLYSQREEERRMRRASDSTTRARTKEARDTKADLKKAKGDILTLTKREHAKSKEKSAAAYSSIAATTLILSYQIIEISGGFGRWAPLFEHEACIGTLQVLIGSAMAWAMRPLR